MQGPNSVHDSSHSHTKRDDLMDTPIEESAVTNLVASLEQSILMIKQLQFTTDPSQILQIYSSLHSSHHHLSSFLSQSNILPPQPEISLSSAAAGEPMQVGDGEEEADTAAIEERMRDFCLVRNKRPKRSLSPAAAAEAEAERRRREEEVGRGAEEFDPVGNRLRSLNLIYQFHS